MKNAIILCFYLVVNYSANCQAPPIQWQKCYSNNLPAISKTNNSDYIISSTTGPFFQQGVLTRIDTLGNIIWGKTYGGSDDDVFKIVIPTNDKGFIGVGNTYSVNISGYHNSPSKTSDIWIIKLDSFGNTIWQKAYGGFNDDYSSTIKQTSDGGYIVGGFTNSNDGDLSINKGGVDFWLFKIDSVGVLQWQKTYGGSNDDKLFGLDITTDKGYVLTGGTYSVNGDISLNKGQGDVWVVKVDSLGNIQWQKTYGGNQSESACTILQTPDKGYIIAARSNTINNGDVLNVTRADENFWVFKTDSLGVLQWQKTYGGESYDYAWQMIATIDGGYAIIGTTASIGGDVSGNHTGGGTPEDYWLLKINNTGVIQWQKTMGSGFPQQGYSVLQTNAGAYMVAGYNGGNGGDVNCSPSGPIWVVRLAATSPLPLKFINYSIILRNEKSVENIWTTVNEINVSHFNIQRSINSKDFYTLQKVVANNKIYNEYSYLDIQPILGDNYYRIESVDKDGNVNYSEIKLITLNPHFKTVSIYPNPAKDYIYLSSQQNIKELTLINQLGQIVQHRMPNTKEITINISRFPKGIYVIQYTNSKGETDTQKIIIN